jgi:biopolymer transport protein ExbB
MSWLRRTNVLLLAALVILLLNISPVRAEAPAEVADGPAAPEAKKAPETLLELIVAGGPINIGFLSVLGLFSFISLAITLERLVNLTSRKLMPPEFLRDLQELIRRREDNPQPFRELSARYPSVIATILRAAVLRAGRPVPEVEKGMEDAAARELGELRSRVRPLMVLGMVGPLVGLLGTAVGMILVFRTASQHGMGNAPLLAEGIYLKLMTTVGGLIVAIPSLLFAALFNSRSEKFMRIMDEQLMESIPCFARMEQKRESPLTEQLVNVGQ